MNLGFVLIRKHSKMYKFRYLYKTSLIPLISAFYFSFIFKHMKKKRAFFFGRNSMHRCIVLYHFLHITEKCCLSICRFTNSCLYMAKQQLEERQLEIHLLLKDNEIDTGLQGKYSKMQVSFISVHFLKLQNVIVVFTFYVLITFHVQ